MRRADLVTLVVAVAVHAGFALMMRARGPGRPPRKPIEVEIHRPVVEAPSTGAPGPRQPERARQAPPRHKLAAGPRARTPQPIPAAPKQAAPPKPMPPVFGVAMDSTTSLESSMAVPVGDSLSGVPGAPSARGRGAAGPSSGQGGDGDYRPASEMDVATMPDVDSEACGRSVTYPPDAEQNGIAGEVRLRVSLDERGHVRAAKVLTGLGHGLDQAAVEAIKHRCRFTPAKDKRGEPVAFVIQSYAFHFELPR